jgi:hypothetical protein
MDGSSLEERIREELSFRRVCIMMVVSDRRFAHFLARRGSEVFPKVQRAN